MYLRMLTSGYIKANSVLFENFADFDIYGGVYEYCAFEVDPIDKEAD
jgi:ubiquitin thioesterase protein OTUB1